jgi:hypothetical protein
LAILFTYLAKQVSFLGGVVVIIVIISIIIIIIITGCIFSYRVITDGLSGYVILSVIKQ